MSAAIMLCSGDATLSDSTREVVNSLSDCEFLLSETLDDLFTHQRITDSLVILLDVSGITNAVEVASALTLLQELVPGVPTVGIHDGSNSERVLGLLRMGMVECIGRPIVLGSLKRILDRLTLQARYPGNPDRLFLKRHDAFVAKSAVMQHVLAATRRAAASDATILLFGETGVGKSCLAKLIHDESERRQEPFFTVNCAALSHSLIDSELFGHQKGAFTGADANRIGKLEEAKNGTLFLDEIDTLPLDVQGKLLRAVDERVLERVGSNRSIQFKARLVAAADDRLEESVAKERFRADLFYRLSVVDIHIPPLRDRIVDIVLIAEKQLAGWMKRNNGRPFKMAAATERVLENYHWPGNIRELQNAMERAVMFAREGTIYPQHLPDRILKSVARSERVIASKPNGGPVNGGRKPGGQRLAAKNPHEESGWIRDTLDRNGNNRTQAARELGISRTALYKKIKQYDL